MTDTFSWDDCGLPNAIEVEDICHTVRHGYGKGYDSTRAGSTKMQKRFKITWESMTVPSGWLWLSSGGSVRIGQCLLLGVSLMAFTASPGYGGYGGLEPDDGFDADYDTGFGGGPAFTVKFEDDSLIQKYVRVHQPLAGDG